MTRRLSGVLARLAHRPTCPSRTSSRAPFPRRPCESNPRRFTHGRYSAGWRRAAPPWYVTGGIGSRSRGVAPVPWRSDRARRVRCLATPRKPAQSAGYERQWQPVARGSDRALRVLRRGPLARARKSSSADFRDAPSRRGERGGASRQRLASVPTLLHRCAARPGAPRSPQHFERCTPPSSSPTMTL